MSKAKEIMITEVIMATEEPPVEEMARAMLRYDIDHIPVARDGMPIGLVARHDVPRMIAAGGKVDARGWSRPGLDSGEAGGSRAGCREPAAEGG
jgi:CBS domain-containing protein